MGGEKRETRTYVEIDGREYLLGKELDLVEVMGRIETAARSEPTFVDLSDLDHLVSVLISPRSKVVVTVRHASTLPPEEAPPGSAIRDWEL